MAAFNDARRENLVIIHRASGEVASKVLTKNSCPVCFTVHLTNPEYDCFHMLTAGGPRVARFLKNSPGWKKSMEMAIIGFSTWLYLPPLISTEILNLGQFHMGNYSAGRIEDQPGYRIDKSAGSLHTQLNSILGTLYSCKTVKVLIEYQEPPNPSTGTQLEVMIGFLRVIKDLQKFTWHQLIVLTSPFRATAGDTDISYRNDSWQRYVSNQILEVTSRAMGVPCFNPTLQQVTTEDRLDLVMTNPVWHKEHISTPIGNITRELMFRQGVELSLLLDQAKKAPVKIPRFAGYEEQDH
jgi:hypothetical protein